MSPLNSNYKFPIPFSPAVIPSPSPYFNLDALPTGLKTHLMQFISSHDQSRMSCTSRSWKQIISGKEISPKTQSDICERLKIQTNSAEMAYRKGLFYKKGTDEMLPSGKKALAFFTIAAQKGHIESFFLAGNLCFHGHEDLVMDLEQAVEFFEAGAEHDDLPCILRLARCYESGIGTPRNLPLAYENYYKAARLGDYFAMTKLGTIFKFNNRDLGQIVEYLSPDFDGPQDFCRYWLKKAQKSASESTFHKAERLLRQLDEEESRDDLGYELDALDRSPLLYDARRVYLRWKRIDEDRDCCSIL